MITGQSDLTLYTSIFFHSRIARLLSLSMRRCADAPMYGCSVGHTLGVFYFVFTHIIENSISLMFSFPTSNFGQRKEYSVSKHIAVKKKNSRYVPREVRGHRGMIVAGGCCREEAIAPLQQARLAELRLTTCCSLECQSFSSVGWDGYTVSGKYAPCINFRIVGRISIPASSQQSSTKPSVHHKLQVSLPPPNENHTARAVAGHQHTTLFEASGKIYCKSHTKSRYVSCDDARPRRAYERIIVTPFAASISHVLNQHQFSLEKLLDDQITSKD